MKYFVLSVFRCMQCKVIFVSLNKAVVDSSGGGMQ